MMRILLAAILLFAFETGASGQDIFIPFKGRKEILSVEDQRFRDRYATGERPLGERCGNYFWYEQVADQQILSFGRARSKGESGGGEGVITIERVGLPILVMRLVDDLKFPTAQWESSDRGIRMIIRISKEDHKDATCLPAAQ